MYAFKTRLRQHQQNLKHLSTRIFNAQSLVLSQQTPFEVIATLDHASLRYYPATVKKYREPLVFVAPLAVSMAIYDLYPYRSLVKHFQNQGFDVYLMDWGKLDFQHRDYNFFSFIDHKIPYFIEQVLEHAQVEQISLHGWSMAGIFVTLYTARHQPQTVKNLMVMGSPIDSYASGRVGKLFETVHRFVDNKPKLKQHIFEGKIPKQYIHTPGILNALGFKILDPKGWLNSHKQLLLNLHNPEHLHEHATLGDFLNRMIDYPGGINQDMVLHLWLQNPLKHGAITLHGETIQLTNIKCSLMVGAGKNDQIVTADAARPLTKLTSSTDVTFTLIPGGHLGLMSSQNSANEFWPTLTTWLCARSTTLE